MKLSRELSGLLKNDRVVIFDIGARGGFHRRWNALGSNARFVGFEPDEGEYKKLEADKPENVLYINAALDDKEQERTLYLCESRGCSSLYKPNTDFTNKFSFGWAFNLVDEVKLSTKTMDDVCETYAISPDVLKIDTQGAELNILRGGEKALKNVLLVEAEVSFQELYSGAPLFSDIDRYLRANGFCLLGLRRSYWRFRPILGRSEGGHLVHGDALYYKCDYKELSRVQQIKMMSALLCYRQYDFVAHLSQVLGFPEFFKIIPSANLVSRFFGAAIRGKVHRFLRKSVDRVRYKAKDWHDPDFF